MIPANKTKVSCWKSENAPFPQSAHTSFSIIHDKGISGTRSLKRRPRSSHKPDSDSQILFLKSSAK